MTDKTRLGKYEILEELGRGGFGVVYKARDAVLDRVVAVKVLHPNLVNDLSFVSRFRNEARLAAQLDHPNIVPVYDFGESEGLYYIVMAYMPGGSLKELLQKEGALPEEKALAILNQVADGLSYAHRKGIIHRDLKPGNILFDEEGAARISDLGFAKLLHSDSSSSLTMSGGLVGTPAYMAPEIWEGLPASPASDIYSLGCILYEILTGKVLFEGDNTAEVITKHVIHGPKFSAELPEEWKAFLSRCVEKDPEVRFRSIDALMDHFKAASRRHEVDSKEQISYSTEPDVEPMVTDQSPLVHLDEPEEKSHEDSNEEVRKAVDDISKSETSLSPHSEELGASGNSFSMEKFLLRIRISFGFLALTFGIILVALSGGNEGIIIIGLVLILGGAYSAMNDLKKLSSQDMSHPILPAPVKTSDPTTEPNNILSTPYSPVSAPTLTNRITPGIDTPGLEGSAQLQIIIKGTILEIAYSPDGDLIAVGTSIGLYIYDSRTLAEVKHFANEMKISSVTWSPNGSKLASGLGDGTIRVWDVENGRQLQVLERHFDRLLSVAWSPNGSKLASGSGDGTIRIWDAVNGSQLRVLRRRKRSIISVAWSPDGTKLASGSDDNTIRIWDAESGSQLWVIEGHSNWVCSVVWSPDGTKLASGSDDNTIRIWDAVNGSQVQVLRGYRRSINVIAWSPDSSRLSATGSRDGTIHIWDAESASQLQVLEGHSDRVRCVAWSPDGARLASGSTDGTIRIWGVP